MHDGGPVRGAGHDVVADRHAVLRRISLTGQYAAVDELQTGRENLEMMGRLRRLAPRAALARAADLREQVDLPCAGDPCASSAGCAAATSRPPRRQPRGDLPRRAHDRLDPRARRAMWEVVTGLTEVGVTVFLTTQYLDEAEQLADTIAVLDRAGRRRGKCPGAQGAGRWRPARFSAGRRVELRGVDRLPRGSRDAFRPLDADDRSRDRRQRRRRACAVRRARSRGDSNRPVRAPDGQPRRRLHEPDQSHAHADARESEIANV